MVLRIGIFGAPDMASVDMRLTNSSAATSGSHFRPRLGPGMDSGGAAAVVSISGKMMCHPLFDGASPCHYMSYCFLDAAPPGHFYVVVGIICWKWSQWRRLYLTWLNFHHIWCCCPFHGSVDVYLQVTLPESCATTSIWRYSVTPLLCCHCSANTCLCHGYSLGKYSSLESFPLQIPQLPPSIRWSFPRNLKWIICPQQSSWVNNHRPPPLPGITFCLRWSIMSIHTILSWMTLPPNLLYVVSLLLYISLIINIVRWWSIELFTSLMEVLDTTHILLHLPTFSHFPINVPVIESFRNLMSISSTFWWFSQLVSVKSYA